MRGETSRAHNWKRNFLAVHLIRGQLQTHLTFYTKQATSRRPHPRPGPEMGSRETIYKLPCAGCGKFGGTSLRLLLFRHLLLHLGRLLDVIKAKHFRLRTTIQALGIPYPKLSPWGRTESKCIQLRSPHFK